MHYIMLADFMAAIIVIALHMYMCQNKQKAQKIMHNCSCQLVDNFTF